MILALDIDDTITRDPPFYRVLANAVKSNNGKVLIVSSRNACYETEVATRKELSGYGIQYDALHLLPSIEAARGNCPHNELDNYQKYIWQKVDYCLRNKVTHYFDDETKVIELFLAYAPKIIVYQCWKSIKIDD